MSALDLMITVWGILIAGFTALMVYRGQLTQYETDELFLSESGFDKRETEHQILVQKVARIRPLVAGFGGATAVMTVAILAVVVAQALPYVKF